MQPCNPSQLRRQSCSVITLPTIGGAPLIKNKTKIKTGASEHECAIAALLCKTSKADAFMSKNLITLTQTQRHLTASKRGLFTNYNK